ncbi:MAG: PH domain-containing protein [Clostridiales bacterium]|nr:PH domain-containing protein [Clostridiales bacterium]
MEEKEISVNTSENQIRYEERKRTLFLGLPICFTKYQIGTQKLTRKAGLFSTSEDDIYLYKIQDVRLTRSFLERLFGTGTVICFGGDVTDPELKLIHIKHAKEIKDYIMDAAENERIRKRTLHTLDISGTGSAEMDFDDLN